MEGNQMKMREAAVTVYDALEKLKPFSLQLGDVGRMREFNHLVCLAKNRLDAALSAPPRQCDVGTPEEQIQQFNDFCDEHYNLHYGESECGNCPLWTSGLCGSDCQLRWAQMPYKAEEGGAE